jgi:hemerythrin
MTKLVWQDDLNTGIAEIDGQHRQIVALINQLDDARRSGNRRAIGEVIEGMVDYTMSHFSFEEALMEDAGYEFVRGHRKVHELFIRRVDEYRQKFVAGENVVDGLHGVLSRWLISHIRNDDAGYVRSVRATMQHLFAAEQPSDGWLARSLARFFRVT